MRKAAILTLCLSIFLAGCSPAGGQVEMRGEVCALGGRSYIAVGGKAVKDKLFGSTADGIKVYGVKNDPDHVFVLDSFGELYVVEGYEAENGELTGVFLEGEFCRDEKLLSFLSDLRAEARGSPAGMLEPGNVRSCQVYNTPDSRSIYLCYDGIEASCDFLGYIERGEQGYWYIGGEEVRGKSLSPESGGFLGIRLHSSYDDLLDEYF